MKKLYLLIVLVTLLFSAKTVFAQDLEKINNFGSDISVNSDGTLTISEEIKYDFGANERHGIFRQIPFVYSTTTGDKKYLEFKVEAVKRDGQEEKYSTYISGNDFFIKIGDPNETISSVHDYSLVYQVTGAIVGYPDYDELYWNVTGSDWTIEIEQVQALVTLPKDGIVQSACYLGVQGSKETCDKGAATPTQQSFTSSGSVLPGENFTIAMGFTKGMVPLLSGKPPKDVLDSIFSPINLISSAGLAIIGFGIILLLWFKKGRDKWFGRDYLFGKEEQKTPIVAYETVVVEFSPPENLRPAELGALLDERADTLDVTATLIDIASRGYLNITEVPKKGLLGTVDYVFDRQEKDTNELREYEQELLLRLFDEKSSVKLSSLKNKFYKDLAEIKEKLYLDMLDRKFFLENPQQTRLKYSGLAILIGVGGGLLIWLANKLENSLWLDFGVVLILLGIVFLIVAQFMPRRTALGRQMFARAKGYRLFVDKAEKYRQRFFEQKNLFNEVLPYAIAFGITEKFAKAFKKMGLEPEQPDWYSSPNAFNIIAFSSAMNSFSTSVQSSMASAPSSSGSGGGGSSGGGFGGGGGGSW